MESGSERQLNKLWTPGASSGADQIVDGFCGPAGLRETGLEQNAPGGQVLCGGGRADRRGAGAFGNAKDAEKSLCGAAEATAGCNSSVADLNGAICAGWAGEADAADRFTAGPVTDHVEPEWAAVCALFGGGDKAAERTKFVGKRIVRGPVVFLGRPVMYDSGRLGSAERMQNEVFRDGVHAVYCSMSCRHHELPGRPAPRLAVCSVVSGE